MVNITLKKIYLCDHNHWMARDGIKKIVGTKEIKVPSIDYVKFLFSKEGDFFTKGESYDAIKHGEDIFRVFYDTKSCEWIAEKVERSPRQGPHFIDFVKNAIEKLKADGFEVVND